MLTKTRVFGLLICVLFAFGIAGCGGDDGVSPVNEGPKVATGIPDLAAKAGDAGVDDYIDLDDAFSDDNFGGKRLTYRIVENTDESLVTATIDEGGRLDLTFLKDRCCATITVEAKDGEGMKVQDSFEVCLYQNPRLPGVACWEAGNIYTVVGTGFPAKGEDGLPPEETGLYWPQDINFSPNGTPYVVDWNNHRVISMDPDRTMRTVIGGRFGDGEDGVATEIGLNHPTHVSFDPQGYLILTAWHNSFLKRLDLSTGYITTFCGTGARSYNGDGIPAAQAFLDLPASTAFDSQGRLYLGDQANQRIRMIDDQGLIQTVAGNGAFGFSGDGGPATSAQLFFEVGQAANPSGKIIIDPDDNLYITDTRNHCIRKVDSGTGIITTIAGIGTQRGFSGDGGPATDAKLNEPRDITMDADGNLYIADTRNFCIRMVDTSGIITTVAGIPGSYGYSGDGGPPTQAELSEPYGVEIGPDGNLWITDTQNNAVRVIY